MVAVLAVASTSALLGGGQTWATGTASYFTKLTGSEQSLTEARSGAVAATLANGEVLIAGGYNDFGGLFGPLPSAELFLSNAELFNPATDTFTKLTSTLAEPRTDAVAATLPDGQVPDRRRRNCQKHRRTVLLPTAGAGHRAEAPGGRNGARHLHGEHRARDTQALHEQAPEGRGDDQGERQQCEGGAQARRKDLRHRYPHASAWLPATRPRPKPSQETPSRHLHAHAELEGRQKHAIPAGSASR